MKKLLSAVLLCCLMLTAAACGGWVADTEDMSDAEVDIDLTALSSTMVYAEVYNIMTNPGDYIGKTFKVSGIYRKSFYNVTQTYYHYIVVEDATACCASGFEFIRSGEFRYPDDYPEDGTRIEVIGMFGSYIELGDTYYFLLVEDMSVI